MITLPEDFALGLQKVEGLPIMSLALRTNENVDRGRVGFINRKQDRFTFSIRYYYDGVTTQGKRWGKWQTLNAFSATLKNGRLNLFMIGNLMGRVKFPKVRNITRQPYLIKKAFGSSDMGIIEFLQSEFDLLYTRNKMPSVFSTNKNQLISEVVKACYPAWYFIHYEPTGPYSKIPIPPLFATDIMREPTIELALDRLTTEKEPLLKKAILDSPHETLTSENIWKLAVSKKRLTEKQRMDLLFSLQSATNYGNDDFSLLSTKNDKTCSVITADDLAQARNLLKPLSQDQMFSITSSPANQETLNAVVKWRENKAVFKAMSLQLTLTKEPTWGHIHAEIKKLQVKTYPLGSKDEREAIKGLLEGLSATSGGLLKPTETFYRGKVATLDSFIDERYNSRNGLPIDVTESSSMGSNSIEYYNFGLPYNVDITKSTYFTILKELGLRTNRTDGSMQLSVQDYNKFVITLIETAKNHLTKYRIEPTSENISLYVASLQALTHSQRLACFKGMLPPKWFSLTRKGLSPFSALFFLEKRVSIKAAIDFVDVPKSWVMQAFGVNPEVSEMDPFS